MEKIDISVRPNKIEVIKSCKVLLRFNRSHNLELYAKQEKTNYDVMKNYYLCMKKYSIYCKPDMIQEWGSYIEFILRYVDIIPNQNIYTFLEIYEIAACIIEDLALGISYEQIKIKMWSLSQNLQGQVAVIVVQFTPYAIEFVQNVVGLLNLKKAQFESLADMYNSLIDDTSIKRKDV